MMQATGITTYQVVATWDRRTCPVCKNIDGKIFDVPQAHAKMTEYLDIDPGNPEAIAEAMPFVRFSDVDNKSPKEVRAMGLTPPFHPRCRCDVVVLGTRTVRGAGPRPTPPTTVGHRPPPKAIHIFNDKIAFGTKQIIADYAANGIELTEQKAKDIWHAFNDFGGDDYWKIRAAARGEEEWKAYKKSADLIEEYLKVSPGFASDTPLFRGLLDRGKQYRRAEVGDLINDPAMSSWTSKEEVVRHFAPLLNGQDAVLKIKQAPRGTVSVGNITTVFGEQEVMMSGKTKLRIVSKKHIVGEKKDYWEILVEEVE